MHAWFHWYRKYTIPNPCPWRVSLQSRQDLLWQLSVETFMNHEGYTSTKSSKTDKYTWCCRLVSAIITQISQEWYTLPSERTYLQETYHQWIVSISFRIHWKTLSTYHPYGRKPKSKASGSRWEHRLACNWTMCSCNLNADAAWPRPDDVSTWAGKSGWGHHRRFSNSVHSMGIPWAGKFGYSLT